MVINVISFFAGCGGSSLGYRMAGCTMRLASDFERQVMTIYAHNFPDTPVLCKDIREVTSNEILSLAGISQSEIDILDGSPPCTAFSICGLREKRWGKSYQHSNEFKPQRVDDLFFEYIRLISELKPKTFVAENVKGLIIGAAKGYYNEILARMKRLDYDVKAYLLDAADYGVAQHRQRVIFIGIRNDIKQDETVKLEKQKQISFLQAIRGLKIPQDEIDNVSLSFANSIRNQVYRRTKDGQPVSKVHPKKQAFNYARCQLNAPISTIVAHSNMLIHPTENRWLTTSELKRCASFPDDFWFPSHSQANVRMGNSVPPKLMKAVAEYVIQKARLT